MREKTKHTNDPQSPLVMRVVIGLHKGKRYACFVFPHAIVKWLSFISTDWFDEVCPKILDDTTCARRQNRQRIPNHRIPFPPKKSSFPLQNWGLGVPQQLSEPRDPAACGRRRQASGCLAAVPRGLLNFWGTPKPQFCGGNDDFLVTKDAGLGSPSP